MAEPGACLLPAPPNPVPIPTRSPPSVAQLWPTQGRLRAGVTGLALQDRCCHRADVGVLIGTHMLVLPMPH